MLLGCLKQASFFGLVLLSLAVLPNDDEWKTKIHPDIYELTQNEAKIDFLVYLNEQADLSYLKQVHGKNRKGQLAYQNLRATADKTQKNIRKLLSQSNTEFSTFFVVNSIAANGDLQLIERIAKLPEVHKITSDPWTRFDPPIFKNNNENLKNGVEWGVQKIQANRVWEEGHLGEGVIIGTQDTGTEWDHPALINSYAGYSKNQDGEIDHNFAWHDAIREISPLHNETNPTADNNPCGLDSSIPCDDFGHGTYVVGITTGDDGNGNQIGVAPQAKWVACRSMERGWGKPSSYIECFEWFLAPTDISGNNPDPSKAPHVINNSWGCPPEEGCNSDNWEIMNQVVKNVKAAGIFVAVAAGNDGPGCATIFDPTAIFETSFSIGSTQSDDVISHFSSVGPVLVDGSSRIKPNVVAPGSRIRSASLNGRYNTASGTSAASPHVAGVVALMISANPNLAGEVDLLESILEETAVSLIDTMVCNGLNPAAIPNHIYGFGRVNAYEAVLRSLETSSTIAQNDNHLEIFPNPFYNSFNLLMDGNDTLERLELYDAFGRSVFSRKLTSNQSSFIETPILPTGIYYYRIITKHQQFTGKLIKQ